MRLISQGKIVEQKSKFFAYLFDLENFEEFQSAISFVKEEHAKARHICTGAVFDADEIFKNDGEVGNPGKRLLDLLKHKDFKNHALIVARYFGGVKLGPAGVGKAFQKTGEVCFSSL